MTIFFTLLASLFSLLYSDHSPSGTSELTNEHVFFNGSIYTVDPKKPWASAIYIKNGLIEYVGDDTKAKELASAKATFTDLKCGFVLPGIHDVHVHPLEAATNNYQFILDDRITDAEKYAKPILNASKAYPHQAWLLGWGHWIDVLLQAERPPREIIDEAVSDRPVAILEQTSHSVWCNSKALALMGINKSTPNPTGGIIMKDASGQPNGLLIDNAGNLLLDLALSPTPERAKADYEGLLEFALPEMAKYGITSISDARTYWKRDHHLVWKKIAQEGKLTARVNLGLWLYPQANDSSQIAQLKILYWNDPKSLLKFNQIKLYADGIIHNTTAAMHEEYLVSYFGERPNTGLNYFTQARIATYMKALAPQGYDFHIHAIGNRGVHEALNAIELAGPSSGRHRLTHVEYIDTKDLPRFKSLNVTADAQVAGSFSQPQHWHDNDFLIGEEANRQNIPLKNLFQAGARITLSSDWDVSELNPFIGLQNAVTRNPQQISLKEAIKAYTIHGAYVMRQEHLVGSLEKGKEADFIILDQTYSKYLCTKSIKQRSKQLT